MKYGYTADEVFEIAEDVEREGYNFYSRAAEHARKPHNRELFQELAETSLRHIDALHTARSEVVTERKDSLMEHPDMSISLYLRTVARGAVYDAPERVDEILKTCKTEKDILTLALNKELDAMLYFFEMNDLIVTEAARKAVEEVIQQKRKHIVSLNIRHGEENGAGSST